MVVDGYDNFMCIMIIRGVFGFSKCLFYILLKSWDVVPYMAKHLRGKLSRLEWKMVVRWKSFTVACL